MQVQIHQIFDDIIDWILDLLYPTKYKPVVKPVEKSTGPTKPFRQMNEKELDYHSFLSGRKQAPNMETQVLVDGVALVNRLRLAGYAPVEILVLMSKIYGSIVGTLPEKMKDQDGKPLTKADLETNFFFACKSERKITDQRSNNLDPTRILH